jgi:hypothetical protein
LAKQLSKHLEKKGFEGFQKDTGSREDDQGLKTRSQKTTSKKFMKKSARILNSGLTFDISDPVSMNRAQEIAAKAMLEDSINSNPNPKTKELRSSTKHNKSITINDLDSKSKDIQRLHSSKKGIRSSKRINPQDKNSQQKEVISDKSQDQIDENSAKSDENIRPPSRGGLRQRKTNLNTDSKSNKSTRHVKFNSRENNTRTIIPIATEVSYSEMGGEDDDNENTLALTLPSFDGASEVDANMFATPDMGLEDGDLEEGADIGVLMA